MLGQAICLIILGCILKKLVENNLFEERNINTNSLNNNADDLLNMPTDKRLILTEDDLQAIKLDANEMFMNVINSRKNENVIRNDEPVIEFTQEYNQESDHYILTYEPIRNDINIHYPRDYVLNVNPRNEDLINNPRPYLNNVKDDNSDDDVPDYWD